MHVRVIQPTAPEPCVVHFQGSDAIYSPGVGHHVYKLSHAIRIPPRMVMRVAVRDASIPVSWYSVTAQNNKLVFEYENATHTLVIDPGNRNLVQILQAFDAQLKALALLNTPTLDWTPEVNKVTIQFVGDMTIRATSTCLKLLGFTRKGYAIF